VGLGMVLQARQCAARRGRARQGFAGMLRCGENSCGWVSIGSRGKMRWCRLRCGGVRNGFAGTVWEV